MITNWNEATKKIKAFRSYMKNAPKAVKDKKGYLITREEIESILKQKKGKLDGIRIYFGADVVEDFMVPTIVVVGCEKDEEGKYNDYNIPEKNLKTLILESSGAVAKGMSKTATTLPCPTECSKRNILNS
ncbi:hypothetical protein [Foetidibacter luteolus]|uniref:hypothetical protein n=1 Tax=Foetidibacter luteolus TaxID=2608880 RepID=UPI00129AD6D7|nr:hypothetical protein [Foetidibacter luteolus]